MGNKLYVGNLSCDVDGSALKELFSPFGVVIGADIISDRITHQSKGFGFVQMGTDAIALTAMTELNGKSFRGRNMTVNMANPRETGGRGNNRVIW